jgi:uncharacterized integral membrane protein
MQFLKILFWVLLTVIVTLFAYRNWTPVTLNLWGDIQAAIKLPFLLFVTLLLGLLPTWFIMRTKLWAYERRIDALHRDRAGTPAEPVSTGEGEPNL